MESCHKCPEICLKYTRLGILAMASFVLKQIIMANQQLITPLLQQYDLHTSLFPNVIVDITDKEAHNRLGTKANHVAWLTCNLVQLRLRLAQVAGLALEPAFNTFLDQFKGIQDDVTYAPLKEYQQHWEKISPVLRERLAGLTAEQLAAKVEVPGMGTQEPLIDITGFFMYMESYGVGQIALWRRLLGHAAMRYPDQP